MALAFGATVKELKSRLDAEEFKYWMAYYGVEPWGEERGDVRNAIVAQTVAACAPLRGGKVPKLDAFMPFLDRKPKRMTDDEMRRTLEAHIKLTQGG